MREREFVGAAMRPTAMARRWALATILLAWTQQVPAQHADTEEIVVTAQRIGLPYWTVTSPTATVLLLPADGAVPEGSANSLAALTQTLRAADQIHYPGRTSMSLSPFKMAGYFLRWRRMSSLPRGVTLEGLLGPADYRRLVALSDRGLLKRGFERTHPFPLSVQLKRRAFGEPKRDQSVLRFVEQIAKEHSIKRAPASKVSAQPAADAFYNSDPALSVPCLIATVDLVEAGPRAAEEYREAWKARRIRDVIESPVSRAFELCIPPGLIEIDRPDVRGDVRALMKDGKLTVAVVPVISLAKPGGVLDDLSAAGYEIAGPAWK